MHKVVHTKVPTYVGTSHILSYFSSCFYREQNTNTVDTITVPRSIFRKHTELCPCSLYVLKNSVSVLSTFTNITASPRPLHFRHGWTFGPLTSSLLWSHKLLPTTSYLPLPPLCPFHSRLCEASSETRLVLFHVHFGRKANPS